MDKCPKCGNKLSSIDVLCPKCGALVEVVQVKKGTGGQGVSTGLGIPMKKLPQQNLIVYNDDWPSDDADIPDVPEEKHLKPDDTSLFSAPEVTSERLNQIKDESLVLPDTGSYSAEAELGSEMDYLALLQKMKLPELENIDAAETDAAETDAAETDAAETGAADNKSADNPPHFEPDNIPAKPTQHRWLEIEELPENKAADMPENKAADMPEKKATDMPNSASIAPPLQVGYVSDNSEHRYRSERRKASTPVPRRGAGRAILMVFMWLVIASALFFGFYLFDQYVTDRYGTYPAMIYDLTGGNIDLAPSAEATPAETTYAEATQAEATPSESTHTETTAAVPTSAEATPVEAPAP